MKIKNNKKEDKIYTKIDWPYIQGINKCDTIIEVEIYRRNHMSKYILEVCVDSVESAISAYNGGATRIELCSNLVIGGTTPDLELFKTIRKHIQIPINVMIRPRYGDFCYTEYEHEIMCRQVENFKNEGADAVVIGSLNIDGTLNEKQMKELIKEAGQCKITLHRAFDMCKDYFQTMEEAIKLGVDTILTSGGKQNCIVGAETIRNLVEQAEGRIEILVGAGVSQNNIAELIKRPKTKSFHMSGKTIIESIMKYRNPDVFMGLPGISEYKKYQTDEKIIKQVVEILQRNIESKTQIQE